MSDNGNEKTRPKLKVLKGGKDAVVDEGLSYDSVDADLRQISEKAKLRSSEASPHALTGSKGGYDLTVERHVDVITKSATLSLIYPTTDPLVAFEGFTIKDGGALNEEQRHSHTQTLRNNPDPVVTRGFEAEHKIRSTIRKVKQIMGILGIAPKNSI